MAEKENPPPDSTQDSKSGKPTPTPTPIPDSDADSILDFGMTQSVREGASGIIPLADLPDPQSSPSLVSWTEVIRQHRETAPPPTPDTPVEPVKIDSTSDKDLLARIAEQEQRGEPVLFAEPAERDTDKIGNVPMVRDGRGGSSIQLDRDVEGGATQPRSGSAVRFDVKEPPPDAGGAMPSPWDDAIILEAIPLDDADFDDQDLPMADVIIDGSSKADIDLMAAMAGDTGGSVVDLHGGSRDEDIMETPLDEEGSPTGRSSILDVLIDQDQLEEPGIGRAPSDVVDVVGGPRPGVLSDINTGSGISPPAFAAEASLADEDLPDAPMADVADWDDDAMPMMTPVPGIHDSNPEEAVDLYAEGPVSRGITDSGTLQVTDEELEEASRKQKMVESSAIDLSSSPSSSMFDVELEAAANEITEEEEAIDMSLPASADAAGQSSMIRRDELEAEAAARIDKKKKAAPARQEEEEYPPPLPPRGRKPRQAATAMPPPLSADNEAPEEETPRKAGRTPSAQKAEAPRKKGGMLIGLLLGILLAGGGIGTAWYLKQLPNPDTVFGGGETAKDTKTTDADVAKAKKDADDAKKAADDMVASMGKQLKDAGIDDPKPEDGLKKALAAKIDAESRLKGATDALDKAGIKEADAAKAIAMLITAREAAEAEMTAVVNKVKPKKDQKVSDAVQDLLAAKSKAEEDQKKAETAIDASVKLLKDAGIDDPKLEDGLKKAIAGKTDAETKVKNAVAALDKAGVKDPDIAKALAMLIAAKDTGDATVKGIRERLEKAKIVEPNADVTKLLKSVDEAITRASADAVVKLAAEKKDAEDRAAKLDNDLKAAKKESDAVVAKAKNDLAAQKSMYEAKLADVRTPAQVVDVWLPALADKDKAANTGAAIADAELVMKNPASTDADKAKALAVKALALRNDGKMTEARAAFADARKHPGFAKDQAWAKTVVAAADTLENPAAFVGVTQPAPATQQQLRERVENGLKLFEGEKYAKDRARLIAQRSQLKLDANDLPGALADADAAIKAGAGADGQFALARVLEAQGKYVDAETAYREVLKAQSEGSSLYRQASLGLARVLLQKGKPAATPATTSMTEPDTFRARVALMLILLADPESTIPPDIQEALKLADALIAQKEFHGYIIRADALARLGRYNDALTAYSTGVKALKVLPREYDGVLDRILAQHPALQQPDPNLLLDPSRSLKHYAQGLESYRAGQFSRAAEQFSAAIRFWNQDARYMYYLGLSHLALGQTKVADADFKAGALLEMKGLPLPKVITEAFERVQGEPRAAVEAIRP